MYVMGHDTQSSFIDIMSVKIYLPNTGDNKKQNEREFCLTMMAMIMMRKSYDRTDL
jgi:hypothetical protein